MALAVRLSTYLRRTGVSVNKTAAEAAAMKDINRAIAIENELAARQASSVRIGLSAIVDRSESTKLFSRYRGGVQRDPRPRHDRLTAIGARRGCRRSLGDHGGSTSIGAGTGGALEFGCMMSINPDAHSLPETRRRAPGRRDGAQGWRATGSRVERPWRTSRDIFGTSHARSAG